MFQMPRIMATNAMKWAKEKGLTRVNPVHGTEEYRIATWEGFNNKETDKHTTTAEAEVELEDIIFGALELLTC